MLFYNAMQDVHDAFIDPVERNVHKIIPKVILIFSVLFYCFIFFSTCHDPLN